MKATLTAQDIFPHSLLRKYQKGFLKIHEVSCSGIVASTGERVSFEALRKKVKPAGEICFITKWEISHDHGVTWLPAYKEYIVS